MASDLEAELRSAVKNGFLFMTLSREWKGQNWNATYRTTDSIEYRQTSDPDPVEAMKKALRAGTRKSKEAIKSQPPRREVDDLA